VKALFNKLKKKECNVILSAGGIRALAQIGALEVLEENGWNIKNICCISAGSVVGSFYASGLDLSTMKRIAVSTNFKTFTKVNYKHINQGIFVFNGLGEWVYDQAVIKNTTQDRRCTLHIGACSLVTGRRRIFEDPWNKTELVAAIHSTCTIPVVFEPYSYEGDRYADGALWSSAPVHFYSHVTSEKYNKLPTFVINVQDSHIHKFRNFNNPIKVLYRVFEVFQINRLRGLRKRVQSRKYTKICMVEPDLGDMSSFNFNPSAEERIGMIRAGRIAMANALQEDDTFGG
jgi:NTE family protein